MDLPRQNILNINRSRERAVYFRSNGVRTLPLPSDPFSKAYYLAKGFTTTPITAKVQEGDSVKCPICEFVAQSAFGLSAHLRKHIKNEKKEEK